MNHSFIFSAIVIVVASVACHKIGPGNSLGNNFYVLDGDSKKDKIIVYCSKKDISGCTSGIPVVPVYERQFDKDGHYAEYVDSVEYNNKYILVKTIQINGLKTNYWIIDKMFAISNLDCAKIDCDKIIQSHVVGPLDSKDLKNQLKLKNIHISFN